MWRSLARDAAAHAHSTAVPTPDVDQDAFFEALLRLGDTTLILGHRVSEWCGHAPALEEDIALANVALDLIGQTQMWLGLAAEGMGRSADDLAYLRDAWDFRTLLCPPPASASAPDGPMPSPEPSSAKCDSPGMVRVTP